MSNEITTTVLSSMPTIPQAIAALTALEVEVDRGETYEDLRKLIHEAEAWKVLFRHVEEVRHKAEDAILAAKRRIGAEIARMPKATGRDRKNVAKWRNSKPGRGATGIPKDERSRMQALAAAPPEQVAAVTKALRAEGKDATARAVTEALKPSKKEARADKERKLAVKIAALPDVQFGVIYADPEWKFKTRSEKGMDRAADNHYPTSSLEEIKARPVAKIAAPDCALFLWATVPMLTQALEVMATWGFAYKSHWAWAKDHAGTGYWNRNQHEILLLGTRGNPPCPAEGDQRGSVIEAPVRAHSQKPDEAAEMIEAYFPTLPKIELNRRGPPRAGWTAWGNEAENLAAAE